MKILFVNYSMNMGGIETFLMNVIRKIDLTKNNVDFLCYLDTEYDYEKEIKEKGCGLIRISHPDKVNLFKHISQLISVMKNNKYDVVHCNTYFDSGYVMLAAKLCNIKVRVTHSHTTQGKSPKSFIQRIKWGISRFMINSFSNVKISCGQEAGIALFKKSNFTIIENGVNIENFIYNENYRRELRKEYNIKDNQLVIGHIGRFAEVKNHKFIVKIFAKMAKQNDNLRLMLIGDGPEFDNIKKLIADYGIEDKVILTGNVMDNYKYFNVIDCLFFPSLYEGLPVTFVEAQINGLNIVASNTISKQSNLIGNVTFLGLEQKEEDWIKTIQEKIKYRNFDNEYFMKSNYNLNNMVSKLLDTYNIGK